MPSSYTPQQKGAIAQFVGFTSTKDSVAAKTLKAHDENRDVESDEESDEKMDVDPDEPKRQEHARIMKKQCKEQKRGDWKEKKSWTQEGIELACLEGSEQDEQEQATLEKLEPGENLYL
ncbi:hypothetical protein OEA41_009849 [Lepraria neglecta]|uniref:Uncharacterized protein n=1 Tax=Lepraria neglecta TaxID=209136 RepID=A0AAD9YVA5_9LECA|nr:hypothetical protein OEA41_009849 [Lepraria neglecta]